jgi:outer membrane protein assembly factor BamC
LLKDITQVVGLTALCLFLTACSGGNSNSRLDYKEIKTQPGLEVPPDLTAPENTGLEEIPQFDAGAEPGSAGGGVQVLPSAGNIHVERDGALRWLRIDAPPAHLWPKLREFWPTIGLELAEEHPATGIMGTAWAENRADAPGGFLADWVKKVFKNAYSADTRDKYRLRLEPREDGGSELFITHYGLKEVIATQVDEIVETAWEVRPSDPELANEVMNRLVLFLGGDETTARAVVDKAADDAPQRARLEGDAVMVSEGFSRTWRRTGIALDRLGLVIDDRNRSAGIYYISKIELLDGINGEDNGWFGGLFSSDDEESVLRKRQVLLKGNEQQTRIQVLDDAGNPDGSESARFILQRLQEALK